MLFEVVFYSYVPLYGLFAEMLSDYFAMGFGQWQGLVRKLIHSARVLIK